MQVQGDRRPIMLVCREMADLLGIRNVDAYFADVVIDLLKDLAALMDAVADYCNPLACRQKTHEKLLDALAAARANFPTP